METLQLEALIDALLSLPCRVIDALPRRVSAERSARFEQVARYLLTRPRVDELRRRFALTLIELSCYFDARFITLPDLTALDDDSPQEIERLIVGNSTEVYVILDERALITLDVGDTYMTLYTDDCDLAALAGSIAASQGLFLWAEPV